MAKIDDDFSDAPLTPQENARTRRMLADDAVARKFKTTVKVWIITLGSVAASVAALKTLFGDALSKMLK